ncbi:MAG: hypothetical protein EBX36_09855, partial [Planctomycetia bacterium]|nr:hypothetical protein [Planctomycetia bacterium]
GDARLEPVCVVPPSGELATLVRESTARLVARDGNAVWVAAGDGATATPEIACIPIVERERPHAAIVASAPAGSIRGADFDFLVALASLASAACAGHADTAAADIASLQTIGLDAVVMLDAVDQSAGATVAGDAGMVDATVTIHDANTSPATARIGSFVAETGTLKLEDWQRILVIEALRRSGGSVPNAAAELGISRATLYRKLESYGLTRG